MNLQCCPDPLYSCWTGERDSLAGSPLLGRGGAPVETAWPAASAGMTEWTREFLSHYFILPPSRMHLWLGGVLAELPRGSRLAVVAPRDSAKSTWLSFAFPLFCALLARERYILLVAETADQARRYLRSIRRELETNEALKRSFPAAVRGAPWSADRIMLGNAVEIEALGTGQSIRGRKNAQSRPSLVVLDDPQDRKHITSPTARSRDWTWFTQDLLNVGNADTNYIVAGTSLHREALVDRLLRQPGWQARRFAAIEKWPANMELWRRWEAIYTDRNNPHHVRDAQAFYLRRQQEMNRGARLCWPQREDLYTLMRLRVAIGRTAFESEKQGNPLSPELCEWPESYFDGGIWFSHWPAKTAVKSMALDPSKGSDARLGDYSALVMVAVNFDGVLFAEADLARRPVEEIVAEGVALYRRFQPDVFGCEANAWQDLLAREFESEFRRQGVLAARPCGLLNTEPKRVRIRRLGPWLSQGRMRFKSQSPGTLLLVEQLQDFPAGDHDDGPDALEMAIRLAGQFLQGGNGDGLGNRLPIGFV